MSYPPPPPPKPSTTPTAIPARPPPPLDRFGTSPIAPLTSSNTHAARPAAAAAAAMPTGAAAAPLPPPAAAALNAPPRPDPHAPHLQDPGDAWLPEIVQAKSSVAPACPQSFLFSV